MLSLLFHGWRAVLAGAAVAPVAAEPSEPVGKAGLSAAELGTKLSAPEAEIPVSGAELPLLESGVEQLSAFEPGLGWLLLQTLLVLAGVVLLAYILLSWGGKYLLKLRDSGGQRAICIVERVSVDARKSLLLVKVAQDYFFLSSGERGVTVLSKLNTQEVEQVLSTPPPPREGSLFLKKLLERKAARKSFNEGES